MLYYSLPLILVILSNVIYQICAKSVPDNLNPMASLTITYLVGAVISGVLYYLLYKNANIIHEYQKLNWAPFAMGTVVIGLEVGWIYAYKVGWPVSTAQIIQSAVLAVMLLFVGTLLYKEVLTWNKLVGIGICLVGLIFINYK